MATLDQQLLGELLQHSLDGIAVVEGSQGAARIVYGNATLATMVRRPEEWLEGRPLEDVEVEVPPDATLTNAGVGVRVRLKRIDGTLAECERWAILLSDGRVALYYRPAAYTVGVHAGIDRSSGLATQEHLLEVLRRDWAIGQRDGRVLTVMRFDLDAWRDYREVFGRSAADKVLRQVARTVASAMRRTSDVVAQYGDDEFVALGVAMEQEAACRFAEQIVARVRQLAIHHPRSTIGRYLTMSAGVVTAPPPRNCGCEAILEAAAEALKQAKQSGGNRVLGGELRAKG